MALFYTKLSTLPMHHRATIHVTQAAGGGTQDATCGAPERMSPTYRRGHVDCQRPLAQVTFSPMREVMIWSTSSIVLE